MISPHRDFNIFIRAYNTKPYFTKGKEVKPMDEMNDMQQDHIVMQNGKVMIMRNSELNPLDEELTMPDGTKVMIDGTVMMPDGTTRMMAEGETMLIRAEGAPAGPEEMSDRQFKETMEDEELRDDIE
jgi:hypothetical protein